MVKLFLSYLYVVEQYVVEQGIMMPNLLQTLKSFWSHSSVFVLEKYPKRVFLPLKEGLVATSSEKRAPTFRKYVAEQDIVMPNLFQSLQFFLVALLRFCFKKKAIKVLNFQIFFI